MKYTVIVNGAVWAEDLSWTEAQRLAESLRREDTVWDVKVKAERGRR